MVYTIEAKLIDVARGKTTEIRFINVPNPALNCILVLPAMGVPAQYYDRLLKTLAKEGWSCGAIDFQGQGKSSVVASRSVNIGYKELLTEDIPAAVTEV